jgi:hypothetical protein
LVEATKTENGVLYVLIEEAERRLRAASAMPDDQIGIF